MGSLPRLAAFSAFVSLLLVLLGPLDIYFYNSGEYSSTPSELVTVLLVVSGVVFISVLAVLSVTPAEPLPR